MGGCITSDVAKLSNKISTATLTSSGVLELARVGKYLDVPLDQIRDKSKANVLGKTLVLLQALWFLVQAIARVLADYPITLLEIHTMVHVGCALAMYALWWEVGSVNKSVPTPLICRFQKPLDVSDPLPVDLSDCMDTLALLLIASPFHQEWSSEKRKGFEYLLPAPAEKSNSSPMYEILTLARYRKFGRLGELESLRNFGGPKRSLRDSPRFGPNDAGILSKQSDEDLNVNVVSYLASGLGLIESFEEAKRHQCTLLCEEKLVYRAGRYRSLEEISVEDVRRWCYAARALQKLPEFASDVLRGRKDLEPSAENTVELRLIKSNAGYRDSLRAKAPNITDKGLYVNWSGIEKWKETFENPILLALSVFLPLVYGSIHLAALNFAFPSEVEYVLWKTAGISIMASTPAWIILPGLQTVLEDRGTMFRHFSHNMIIVFSSLIAIMYICSRVYLVVESFVSLRHLPIGVFAAVPWVQAIPHI